VKLRTPLQRWYCSGVTLLACGLVFVILRLERSKRISVVLLRLHGTTAQIGVRGAFMLLVAFVALASVLGLETILGAFVAGVILRLVDGDRMLNIHSFVKSSMRLALASLSPSFSWRAEYGLTWLRSSRVLRPF
jgi:Kef-type K+ transport system membrane component KefB